MTLPLEANPQFGGLRVQVVKPAPSGEYVHQPTLPQIAENPQFGGLRVIVVHDQSQPAVKAEDARRRESSNSSGAEREG